MTLSQRLDALVNVIEQREWSVRPCLQLGLNRNEVSDILRLLQLPIPPALYDLYEWHNGSHEGCNPLFDEHYFLSLQDAVDEYLSLIPVWQESDTDASIDFTRCLPFAGYMGSYYMIYCNPNTIRSFQYPIIHLFHDSYIAFVNLEAMVTTITMWYKRQAYNMKTLDKSLKYQIWYELNPGLHIERL